MIFDRDPMRCEALRCERLILLLAFFVIPAKEIADRFLMTDTKHRKRIALAVARNFVSKVGLARCVHPLFAPECLIVGWHCS